MADTFLRMTRIEKSFSGVPVLRGIDFDVRCGEVMALIGENGAGKSTLVKILAGVYTDWKGRIVFNDKPIRFQGTRDSANAGIGIVHQELNLVPELTVAENIFLGREPARFFGQIDHTRMNSLAENVMTDLHFPIPVTTPVSRLRIGHRQMVEIGKALSLKARLLIMDEPTSALTEAEADHLFSIVRKLKGRGVSVVYISHRLGEVLGISDRITVLRDGETVGIRNSGNTERSELIRLMVGRSFKAFFPKETVQKRLRANKHEKPFFEVTGLTRRNSNPRQRPILQNISFVCRRGEIVGIAGLLGSGRTELLETLFGVESIHTTGSIFLEGERLTLKNPRFALACGTGFLTEDRKSTGMVSSMSVEENLTLAALRKTTHWGGILVPSLEKTMTEKAVHTFSIRLHDITSSMETLSGGNQQKVLLAKWLVTQPKLLLLDEPTRGIDVKAKQDIYQWLLKLKKKNMCILFSSSEMPEILSLSDRILVMREGQISAVFKRGNATQEKIMEAASPIS